MTASFRARLRNRETLFGTLVSQPWPPIAELLALAGFDWLFLDAEHGSFSPADLAAMMQAAGRETPCLVRVAAAAETPIKQALDAGAAGIIVPQVNTAAQAEQVVAWSRYAPLGSRGVGVARAHGYGLAFQDYLDGANKAISVVVQAEHAQAVANIEAIAAVPGIDAVLVGPYDLSASLGKIGRVTDPEVVAAIERVTAACQAAGLPLGIFGLSAEAVRPYMARGYSLIVAGLDSHLLGAAARSLLAQLRD